MYLFQSCMGSLFFSEEDVGLDKCGQCGEYPDEIASGNTIEEITQNVLWREIDTLAFLVKENHISKEKILELIGSFIDEINAGKEYWD